MIYHVRNWHRYQRGALRSILKSRRARALKAIAAGEEPERIDRPISLDTVAVSAQLHEDALALSQRLGREGRWADAIMLRVLLHVGRNGALRGEIHLLSGCPRGVLEVSSGTPRGTSRSAIAAVLGVSRRVAERAFSALVETRFLVEGPATLPRWMTALTDASTLEAEAARSERRTNRGSERRTEHEPPRVRNGVWGSRGRDTRTVGPSYLPGEGEPPREAVAPPSAGAAGRSAAHGLEDEHRSGDHADAPTSTSRRLSIPARRRMLGMTGGNFHDVVAAWEALSPQERERLVREDDLALAAEEFGS